MAQPTAVSIGNFDGVHLGHVKLVRTARELVGPTGNVIILSFDPHPVSVLRPHQAPARLTHFHQRVELLKRAGANKVVALKPTTQFLSQSASDFITSVVKDHQPTAVIEGPDFHFGAKRAGNVQTLASLGRDLGFETLILEPQQVWLRDHSIVTVSSTMTRWLICRGRMRDATRLLGRPYELVGKVIQGDQRGRTIGIPTINLDHGDLLLPRDGIYAGTVQRGDRRYRAAISVGTKPTFGSSPRVCEAHMLGYDGPLDDYGWDSAVSFDHWIRDQLVYRDVELLKAQIARDIAHVTRLIQQPFMAEPAGRM
jgi:riboflavin kinase/FMN adenylyltransferase